MILNTKQLESLNKINDFINQTVHQYFYLFGYAGTGKTFITNIFVNELVNNNSLKHIYICAPTHTALNVLESYFKNNIIDEKKASNKTKVSFMTIHKLLEFRPYISNNNGEQIFKSKNDSKKKQMNNKLIVIDECSMISADLAKEIDRYKNLYPTLKFIFLGDIKQLPPVHEKSSVIFLNIPKHYQYHIILDEIMRTKSHDIKMVSKIIRSWDQKENLGKLLLPIHNNNSNPKTFKLYHKKVDNSKSSWFLNNIKKINNGESPIILTWKNSTSDTYNRLIRQHIHHLDNIEYSKNFMVNDHVMFTKYYQAVVVSQSDEIINAYFYTADMIKIQRIVTLNKNIYQWSDMLLTKAKSTIDIAYNNLINKIIKMRFTYKVDIYEVNKINNKSNIDIFDNNIYNIKAITVDDILEYKKMLKIVQEHLEYFCTTYKLNEHSTKLWRIYHHNLINPYAELSLGYSITTHKAQASTFSTVIVDVADICDNPDIDEAISALYTATTRSSETLDFLVV